MFSDIHAPCVLVKDGHCPNCNGNWDGGAIFNSLRQQPHYEQLSDEELAILVQECYGDKNAHWSRLQGIEIQGKYDGVSLWQCPDCQHTWNAPDVVFAHPDDD